MKILQKKKFKTGRVEWRIDGILHREDGPAVIKETGVKEWWLNGKFFKSREFWLDALPKDKQTAYLFTDSFARD